MTELSKEEKKLFNNLSEELLYANQNSYPQLFEQFKRKDSTFEYSFLYQRLKISSLNGPKALHKTIKEIRAELHIKNKRAYIGSTLFLGAGGAPVPQMQADVAFPAYIDLPQEAQDELPIPFQIEPPIQF